MLNGVSTGIKGLTKKLKVHMESVDPQAQDAMDAT